MYNFHLELQEYNDEAVSRFPIYFYPDEGRNLTGSQYGLLKDLEEAV